METKTITEGICFTLTRIRKISRGIELFHLRNKILLQVIKRFCNENANDAKTQFSFINQSRPSTKLMKTPIFTQLVQQNMDMLKKDMKIWYHMIWDQNPFGIIFCFTKKMSFRKIILQIFVMTHHWWDNLLSRWNPTYICIPQIGCA